MAPLPLTPRVITLLIVLIALLIAGEVLFFEKWMGMVEREHNKLRGNVRSDQERSPDAMEGKKGALEGKERILEILAQADIRDVDEDTIRRLPTWSEATALYGDKPIIYGLEHCERFQKSGDPADHFASVAGAFNSGTNLMSELLIANCHMPEKMKKHGAKNRGIRWQVPWGKHNVPLDKYRNQRQTYAAEDYIPKNVFPAVTIRDPYVWMASMCRHRYGAHWRKFPEHCPNLVPNQVDIDNKDKPIHWPQVDIKPPPFNPHDKTVPIRVDYQSSSVHHDSLAHFWNEWYDEYMNADFPRLIVRYEDLVLFAKEVTETVCKCAGGEMNRGGFTYITQSAKRGPGQHGKERTSFIDAIVRYFSEESRYKSYTKDDLRFAKSTLNQTMLELFVYRDPPPQLLE